ncbi:hypothetical protein [Haladaptatus sp. GCM10025893]|uniref:hypothetical protein n=1 Tax=Haladaptatus sp. GCM10025893 TaxID=3252659 RepID=UPI003621FA46
MALTAGDEEVLVQTDEDGRFTITHRPTTLGVGTSTIDVRYLPDPSSVYLGSNQTLAVGVSQVTPTVQLTGATNGSSLGQQVTATGRVAVDQYNVSNLPVVLTIGGTRIGTTQTDANGSFSFSTALPVGVPAGDQELVVGFLFEDRALAKAQASSMISIARTPSELTIQGNQETQDAVRLTGTLTTGAGTPVDDQPILILVDGAVVSSARTGSDGEYVALVELAAVRTAPNQSQITFVAEYDATRTNLEPARAETVAVYESTGGNLGPLVPVERTSMQPWFEFVSLVATVLVWRVARWNPLVVSWVETVRTGDALANGSGESDAETTFSPLDVAAKEQSLLSTLQQYVRENQTDLAVVLAYTDLRTRLADVVSVPQNLTHWEFVVACERRGMSAPQLRELRRITLLYERSVFDDRELSTADAASALDAFDRFDGGFDLATPTVEA